MGMLPSQILSVWFRGLLSITLLILGPYLLYRWWTDAHVERPDPAAPPATAQRAPGDPAPPPAPTTRVFAPTLGLNAQTALLLTGLAFTLWARPKFLTPLRLRRPVGKNEPRHSRGGTVHKLSGPAGESLHVEIYGPDSAPTLLLTHGWSLNSTEWFYLKQALADRFRLIAWDLPGLGLSTAPADRDFSLDRLADNLDRVLSLAGDRPVTLVGHSIGGMIILTYAKRFPQALGSRVAGMVLTHTTYTNPVKTATAAPLLTALQTPLIVPLCYLTIALSPLVRLMNLLSYANGSSHRSTERTSFSGKETRGQLDFATQFNLQAPPAVVARGMLGMLKYDATDTLKDITIPTLIVAGDRDPLCLLEASQRMHADIPNSELLILDPAKHLGLIEHHARYVDAIAAFTARANQGAPQQDDRPGPLSTGGRDARPDDPHDHSSPASAERPWPSPIPPRTSP